MTHMAYGMLQDTHKATTNTTHTQAVQHAMRCKGSPRTQQYCPTMIWKNFNPTHEWQGHKAAGCLKQVKKPWVKRRRRQNKKISVQH